MANFFNSLEIAKSYLVSCHRFDDLEFLSDVEDFVYGGSYTKSEGQKTFLRMRNLDENALADFMGCTSSNVRRIRSALSKKLYSMFGDDFFDKIYQRKIDDCKLVFGVVSGVLDVGEVIPSYLESLIGRNASFNAWENPSSCINELKFLVKYSEKSIKRDFESIDKKKLAYVANVLSKEETTKDKLELASMYKSLMEKSSLM